MAAEDETGGGFKKRWLRLLHLYVSLYALLVVLFFGATGFMMNHADWFGFGELSTRTSETSLPIEPCRSGDRLAIVEALRNDHALRGQVQQCDVSEKEITVSFASAGQSADIVIDRATGTARITVESKGLTATLAAIHSGDHTGAVGKRIIDIAALFLIVTSLSGLALWTSLQARRGTGLIWLATGTIFLLVALAAALR